MIHVEFGDFSSTDFFKIFEQYSVRNANSLGMNEQEMAMLLDYWNGVSDLNSAKDSKPSFQNILDQLQSFFVKQEEMGLDISRVHLHPYGSFFMCYDTSKWHDAKDAILKSSIAVPKYCLDPSSSKTIEEQLDNFSLGDLPEYFEHPNQRSRVYLRNDTLTYHFDLSSKVHCYL